MELMNVLLTILTPTFNRRNKLPQLFNSLEKQTVKGFQWLVIDDGSEDGTEEYIRSLHPVGYCIDYYRKQNGGKHTALNYSHEYIKGEFICIVDSDDYLLYDAVETISNSIKAFEYDRNIACLSFQKGRSPTEALVKKMPDKPVVSNHIDFRLNENRPGDCCEIVRTSVFKEFPFPEFPGERFISEGYLWINIGKKYKSVYFNKIIYICEYLSDGLTNSGRRMRVKSPLGGMATSNAFLSVKNKPKLRIKILIKQILLYICYGKIAGLSFNKMKRKCVKPFFMTLFYPFGILMYIFWRRKYC